MWINNVQKKLGLNPKLQPKYLGPYYIADVGDNDTYILHDCQSHKPLKSRINAQRMKLYVPETTRTIQLNPPAPEQEDADDRVIQTDLNDPNAVDISGSQASAQGSDQAPGPSHPPPDTPAAGTSSTAPSGPLPSQPSQKVVELIKRCSNYKGKKWYLTKWAGHRFTEWVREDYLPEHEITKFHISKTQSGKSRKGHKKAKRTEN